VKSLGWHRLPECYSPWVTGVDLHAPRERIPMPRLGCTQSGPVPWSSHFCGYYHTSSDLQQLMNAYFQAGLEDHEGCLWMLPPWHTPTTAAS
jgi:hypothetical protein